MKARTATNKHMNRISASNNFIVSMVVELVRTSIQYESSRVDNETGGLRCEVEGFRTFGTS